MRKQFVFQFTTSSYPLFPIPFVVLVSLYILDRNEYTAQTGPEHDQFQTHNPYSRKRRVRDEHKLDPKVINKYVEAILDLVLYDVDNCEALRNFQAIQDNTDCIFSKRAVLWGAHDYDQDLSIGK